MGMVLTKEKVKNLPVAGNNITLVRLLVKRNRTHQQALTSMLGEMRHRNGRWPDFPP